MPKEYKEIIVDELKDKKYLANILSKYRGGYPQIKNVNLENVMGGPLDFSLLQKITVSDFWDNKIDLFAKVYDPKKPTVNFRHPLGPKKRFEYANMHQKFWNYIGICAPTIYDFIDKEEYKVLVMEYWPGPSQDLDVIAIKNAINSRVEDLKTDVHEVVIKRKQKEIEILSQNLDSLVNKILKTINKMDIIGTNKIKEYKKNVDDGFWIYQPESMKDNYLSKLQDYIERITLRQSVLNKDVGINRVTNYINGWVFGIKRPLPKIAREKVTKNKTKIRELFEPLVTDVINKEPYLYSQGDGHLYHFKLRRFGENGKECLESGIFDSCHCGFEPKHVAKTKPLLSYLLDFDYSKVSQLFLHSLDNEQELRKEIKNNEMWLFEDKYTYEDAMKAFDILALLEQIYSIGREHTDELINKVHHDKLKDRYEIYNNPYLKELEGILPKHMSIPLSKHNADYATERLLDKINNRLETMIDRKTTYNLNDKEIRSLDGIKEFVNNMFKINSIMSVNNQQELKAALL